MSAYTLQLRRFSPESGEAPYWQRFTVELDPHHTVLAGILQARDRQDGSIGIRCSCRQAICGSCGVRINGEPLLACRTHVADAAEQSPDGTVVVEPMGNMPVIKDLIVDMDTVHWKKIRQVTPWIQPKRPVPEREYIVPRETMLDITQTMACIQCGLCVSDCNSMEVDPRFTGPAALAKAYRFVGDPRDRAHRQRLDALGEDPHGMYDCTHCFMCVQACPKDVAPMDQIMRLRRIAGSDHGLVDPNNGYRHAHALTQNIRRNGLLHEADLLPASYGGKLHPRALRELIGDLPVVARALLRRKITPAKVLRHRRHPARDAIEHVHAQVEQRQPRYELNLYISGQENEPQSASTAQPGEDAGGRGGPGAEP